MRAAKMGSRRVFSEALWRGVAEHQLTLTPYVVLWHINVGIEVHVRLWNVRRQVKVYLYCIFNSSWGNALHVKANVGMLIQVERQPIDNNVANTTTKK